MSRFSFKQIMGHISNTSISKYIVGFCLWFSGMPLPISIILIMMMYVTKSLFSVVYAVFFTLTFSTWILNRTMSNIRTWHLHFYKKNPQPQSFIVATRSMILYSILFGFLGLAIGFGIVYDSQQLTDASGFWNNLYFSITTLTTVGYGDIHPISYGRLIANLEMLFGLFYQITAISIGTLYLVEQEP